MMSERSVKEYGKEKRLTFDKTGSKILKKRENWEKESPLSVFFYRNEKKNKTLTLSFFSFIVCI